MDFIEMFYNNGIFPSENNNRPACIEYDELQGRLICLNKQLQESLNDEQVNLYNEIMKTKLHIEYYEMATCFANAFQFGGRFVVEIYKDAE